MVEAPRYSNVLFLQLQPARQRSCLANVSGGLLVWNRGNALDNDEGVCRSYDYLHTASSAERGRQMPLTEDSSQKERVLLMALPNPGERAKPVRLHSVRYFDLGGTGFSDRTLL